MPPVALCCCFPLFSGFHGFLFPLPFPSPSHWEEPRAALPILMVWFNIGSQPHTELEPGPRVSSSQPRDPACGPGCLGVRGQCPPRATLPCRRGRGSDSVHWLLCFGNTKPALLGMPAVYLQCQRPPPLPDPPHGLWVSLQEKELPQTHRAILLLRSACKDHPRESGGRALRCSLLHLLTPWPYVQNPGGKKGGSWKRATHLLPHNMFSCVFDPLQLKPFL